MYSFGFDADTKIFHIEAHGHWSLTTLASFSGEALARGAAIRLRYGSFAVLTDLRGLNVLPQEVARGITLLLQQSMRITRAPFALVAPSMLLKLQAARIMEAPHTRVFLDWDEANAWLRDHWQGRERQRDAPA